MAFSSQLLGLSTGLDREWTLFPGLMAQVRVFRESWPASAM